MLKKLFGKNINTRTFLIGALTYLIIILLIALFPENSGNVISILISWTTGSVGWVYVLMAAAFTVLFFYLGFGKYGKIRLGGENAKPELSFFSWMALLIGTGLGIGLVFYGVSEPVTHFLAAPFAESGSVEAARQAMRQTMFHWGMPFWIMYGIIGLAMGYFSHNLKQPMLVSSSFLPMLGEKRVRGRVGNIIDGFSLIATISGVAMALGCAAVQMTSGMNIVFGFPNNFTGISIVALAVTLVAVLTCISGVSKGMKFIGDFNMYIVLALIVFVFVFGGTTFLLGSLFENYGNFLQNLPWMLTYSDSYGVAAEATGYDWISSWTIMYWAWSMAFGPFCGAFLAEISKGRTFKEFVLAVAFVPGILCCVWFNTTGGDAIHMILEGNTQLGERIMASTDGSLFYFLQELPLSAITVPLACILVFTLITTTVNSATHVAGKLSCNGGKPTLSMNIFWGIFIVLTALAIYLAGGLDSLKNASVFLAFPFTIIVVLMVINFLKVLKNEYPERDARAVLEKAPAEQQEVK